MRTTLVSIAFIATAFLSCNSHQKEIQQANTIIDSLIPVIAQYISINEKIDAKFPDNGKWLVLDEYSNTIYDRAYIYHLQENGQTEYADCLSQSNYFKYGILKFMSEYKMISNKIPDSKEKDDLQKRYDGCQTVLRAEKYK